MADGRSRAVGCDAISRSAAGADLGVLPTGLDTRERRQQAEALSQSIREYVDQVSFLLASIGQWCPNASSLGFPHSWTVRHA